MDHSATRSSGAGRKRFSALTTKLLAVALVTLLPAVAQSVEVAVSGPAGVAGGSSYDYTITVSNADPAVADVSVIDTLPSALSFASASGSGWSCSASGNPETVTCDYSGDLPNGNTQLTLTVDADAQGSDTTVTNSVAVEVAGTEEDTDSVDTTIYADDLSVSKSIDDGAGGASSLEVRGGDDVSFDITVTNDAPVAANNVRVQDGLPAGFDVDATPLDGWGTNWSCTVAGVAQQTVSCDYNGSPLGAGATTTTLIITAATPEVENSFTNAAGAESDGSVSAYPFDSADVTIDVYLESDLRVTKTAGSSTVYSGDSVTYSYSISNLGPHDATGLTLTDVFDRDDAIDSFTVSPTADWTASDWTCVEVTPAVSGETSLECQLTGTLPADSVARVLSLTVTAAAVDDTTVLVNQATVTSDQRLPASPQNDSAEVSVTLEPAADLSLDRSGLPAGPVEAESAFSWQLVVDNGGPSLARDLVVSEALPDGVVVTGISGSWSCTTNQRLGLIRCELPQLAAAAQSTITVNARAPRNPAMPGQATADSDFGTATVSASTYDPSNTNNTVGSDSLTVAALWNLSLLKDSASTLLVPGQAFTYEITVENDGPSDLVGGLRPLLDDPFDSRLRGVLGTCTTSAAVPCWSCGWLTRPAWDQTVDDSVSATSGLGGAWPVAVSPDGANVYVGGRFDGAIAELGRETSRGDDFGRLTWNDFNDELAGPRALAVHPSGQWLAAVGYGNAAELQLFSRNPSTGAIASAFTFGETVNQGADLAFSLDGAFLYVAESGADRIRQLAFDAATPALTPVADTSRDAGAANPLLLDGVSGLALGPEGAALFAAAPGDNAVVAFAVSAGSGVLTPFTTASTVLDNGSGAVPVASVVAGTDEVFAGGGDSLFIIERSGPVADLGAATAIVASAQPAKLLEGISGLALSRDESSLYISAAADAAVSLVERNAGGIMEFRRSVAMPDGLQANGLALDGGDERLYVTGTSGPVDGASATDAGAVLVFRTVAPGGCDDLRSGEISNDPIEDVALTVPAGQSLVVTINAAVASGTPTGTMLDNTANLEAALDYDDVSPETLTSTKTLEVRNATKVVVTTDAPGQRPIPGSELAFTVTIVNDGPAGVTGLTVDDVLETYPGNPAGFVPGTTGWQCAATANACCDPDNGQCGVLQPVEGQTSGLVGHQVNVGAQSSLTFTLSGRLHPAAGPIGTITNEVQLAMPAGIEAVSNDDLFDSHSEDLTAEADVWLDKRSLGSRTDEDGNLVVDYELTVGNFGPSAVRAVNLADGLDDPSFDTAAASWSCAITDTGEASLFDSCCDYDGACQAENLAKQVRGELDQDLALAPGAQALFSVTVPVSDEQAAEVQNSAIASLPNDVTEIDSTNNRQDNVVTRLQATADLSIEKTILAGSSVVPGEEVQFQITVRNDGPDGVPVTVSDLFSSDLTDVNWFCDATTPIPGDLSYAFSLAPGTDETPFMDASAVITSDDGRHVYALGAGQPGAGAEGADIAATIFVYERNIVPGPNFGSLVELEVEAEGVDDGDDSGLAVEGLSGGRAMVLSPDQRHLYVASADADAVTVFSREAVAGSEDFGRLSFVESRAVGSDEPADSVSPVTGVRGASDVAVSADGEHVYVVGRDDSAVAVFRRNLSTGTLGFEGQISAFDLVLDDVDGDGIPDADEAPGDIGPSVGLWGAHSIDIAPNDIDLYVTGSGLEALFAGPDWMAMEYATSPSDQAYFVNNTPGIDLKWLTQEQATPIPATFDELYLEFDHRFRLDANYGCFDVAVLQYSLDDGASWNSFDDPGSQFEVGGYNGQQNGAENNPLDRVNGWCRTSPGYPGFQNVRVDLTGLVSGSDEVLFRFGLGEGTAVGGTGWWVDNIRLYAVNGTVEETLEEDSVAAVTSIGNVVHLKRQDDDSAVGFGMLTGESATIVESGSMSLLEPAADLAVADSQLENLYVGDRSGLITVYQRDPSSGELSRQEVYSLADNAMDAAEAGVETAALDGLSTLGVSADGEHLIAGAQIASRLVVFRRLPFVGTLTPEQMLQPGQAEVGRAPAGVDDVRDLTFSSDGRNVFTLTGGGVLGVFDRRAPDPTYGFLEAVFDGEDDGFGIGNVATGLLGARALDISRDGNWIYAAGFGQVGSGQRGSMVVLSRDSGSTEPGRHLGFRQAFRDLQGGVTGLDGAVDIVALTASDENFEDIYVISERDSAIAHFRQNVVTGNTAFVAVYRDGESGISGLAGGASIESTTGGDYLFAAGRFDHAVAVFDRDPDDGSLVFLGEARDGVDGVLGMLGPSDLAVSRNGAHVYVAARQSNSVVVLDHDNGMLTYRQTFYDGTEGAIVTSPVGLDVTYDESGGGEHVIVTSLDGDAVTVLARESDPSVESLYGRVRFLQTLTSSEPGLEALLSPRDVLVDPSNDRVYIAADDGNALIVLDRNTSVGGSQFGQLFPLETRQNDTAGIIGVDRPYGLAVSTGTRRNIYTAALGSQSVAAFVRRAGSSCAASGGGNLAEEVFIANQGTIRFTVSAIVAPGATDPLNNTATLIVGDDVTNTNPVTSDSSDQTVLTPVSELTLSKDNGRLSVTAGEQDSYRIVIGNDGPSHARDVRITDLLSGNPAFDETTAAWSCRAIGTGALDREGTIVADTGLSEGLAGVSSIAWSPAPVAAPELGERVYVTGILGNALTALSIDPETGEFVIDAQIVEGGNDVDTAPVTGLRGARDVAVSSDGDFIYVSSQVDDSLLVFEPDLADPQAPEFGQLRLIQSLSSGSPNLESLDQPQGLTLSGDGDNLYLAAANSGSVYVFDRANDSGSPTYGQLTWIQTLDTAALPELGGASQVVMAPEDDHVYVAGTGAGALVAFTRAADGSLTHLQTRQAPAIAGLEGVADLALSPAGDHLYAIGRDANALVVFPRDNDDTSGQYGRLGTPIQQLDDEPGLTGPRALVVSNDGGSVYVAAFETNSVLIFRRDRVTGELEINGRQVDGTDQSGLAGVSSFAFSGNGETLFTGAVLAGAVARFDRAGFSNCVQDSGNGDVDLDVDVAAGGEIVIDLRVDVFAESTGQTCPEPLDQERQCVINEAMIEWTESQGDRSLTASDASFVGRAARLTIEKSDGLAEFRGLAGARAVAGSETFGSHLYVAAPGEPGIGVYSLAPSTGPTGDSPLSFEQLILNGEGPVSSLNGIADLLVSPDGRHVYAASSLDSAIVVFDREPLTGRLTWVATYSNNASGVIGLSGARSMAMDAQGRHLYVVGTNANAVVIFDRQHDSGEEGFGELAFQGLVQNGTDGVIDMQRPVDVSVSPDDRHVYVAATQSDAVVVFSRNADALSTGFGGLTWRQSRRNLIGNVSGLLDVSDVLVSPNGATVYAAGSGNNAVVWFSRETDAMDADFGRLAFGGLVVDGDSGVDGLVGVDEMQFMGASAEWLVTSSRLDDSVVLFQRSASDGSLGFVQALAGLNELDGARDLWVDSAGGRLHVAAADADSVSVFDLDAGSLVLDGTMVQGGGGAVPGGDVVYLITVTNEGPSRVVDARVTDFFPDVFDSVSWSCQTAGSGGAQTTCPDGTFTGNVDATVSLAAGDSVIIEAEGTLRPDATGLITNTAQAIMPANIVDLSGGDNEAVDDDTTINSRSDLRVEFENLPVPEEAVAGAPFDFRVVVHNDGPGALSGSRVAVQLPEALLLDDWICQPSIEPGILELAGQDSDGLTLGRVAALSRDGRHVYVVGSEAGADVLTVYDRDPLTGSINRIQQLTNLMPDSGEADAPIVDGLSGGIDLVVTPDDSSVYVAGRDDDAIAQFERDAITGRLSFIGVIRDGVGPVDGLAGVRSLAISSSGETLYAAGELDDAIAVLQRDIETGELAFQQVRRNLQDGVQRLDAPVDLLFVDDGAALWVAARDADAIVRFEVAGDGSLTADGFFEQGGSNGDGVILDGLDGVRSLALRDDGVVVALARTASTHALSLFDRPEPAIIELRTRLIDGDQVGTPLATVDGLAGGDSVVVDPARDVIYVASRDGASGPRTVSAFVEDAGTEQIQFLGQFAGGAADATTPAQAALGADGRQLYLVGGGTIDRFRVLAGSGCERVGERLLVDTVDLIADGRVDYDLQTRVMPNARGAFELRASVLPRLAGNDPVIDNNVRSISVPIVAQTGLVVDKTLVTDPIVAGEDVTWAISITNNGPSSIDDILINDFLPTVAGNVPDPGGPGVVAGSGTWQCTGSRPVVVDDIRAEGPMANLRAVAVSEDGTWAVAAAPDAGSLWLYARDPGTGLLALAQTVTDGDEIFGENDEVVAEVAGLAGAADVAFSRDARHVYVVSSTGDSIAWFTLDTDAGELLFEGLRSNEEAIIIGLDGPSRIIAGPADDRLYIGAGDSSAVTVFDRDPVDGSLQWRQSARSGIGLPLNVLDGVRDMVISPDGAHLYAAAAEFDAVVTFTIDGDGELAYLEHIANGDSQSGITIVGLGLVQSLAISPQGRHLYAASLADDSVTLLHRDPSTGSLSWQWQLRNGVEVETGLDGASALAMSSNGQYLYAGSRNDGGILVFEREWEDGALTSIDRLADPSLAGLRRLVGDDGGLLAAVSVGGDELVTLGHRPAAFCGEAATSAIDQLIDSVSLAPDAVLEYSVTALVHPGARGVLTNEVEAVLPADVSAVPPAELTASATGPISVVTDLDVVKSISGETAALVAGGPVGFEIEVENFGPSHGFGIGIADLLPGVLGEVTWTCVPIPGNSAGSSCPASGTGDIDERVDLLAGERMLLQVAAVIDPAFRGQLSNTATVDAPLDGSDPDLDNNQSSVTGTVNAVSDIQVSKTADVAEAAPDSLVTYDITVVNLGPSDAPLVTVVDTPPAGLVFESWTCSGIDGSCAASGSGAIDETVSIDSGGSVSFIVEARVGAGVAVGSSLINQAGATLGGEGSDPVDQNDVDTASVTVVEPRADIQVVKVVDANSALPGDFLEYEITVSNLGPDTADSVEIVDTMPPGLLSVTWTCQGFDGAACATNSDSGDISMQSSLPVGASLVFVVNGQIDPGLPASPDERIVNTASATLIAQTTDPDESNNSDSAETVLDLDVMFRDRFEMIQPVREEP